VLQKDVITQPEAGGWPAGSCGEGEVVHAGDGLDSVVEAVAALSAVAEDLVVLHPGEGVLDAGADLAVSGVVLFLALQQRSPGAFAVRDDQASVDVGAVPEDRDALAVFGQAGVPPGLRVRRVAGHRAGRGHHQARLSVNYDLRAAAW
jgi:hypothetical protein